VDVITPYTPGYNGFVFIFHFSSSRQPFQLRLTPAFLVCAVLGVSKGFRIRRPRLTTIPTPATQYLIRYLSMDQSPSRLVHHATDSHLPCCSPYLNRWYSHSPNIKGWQSPSISGWRNPSLSTDGHLPYRSHDRASSFGRSGCVPMPPTSSFCPHHAQYTHRTSIKFSLFDSVPNYDLSISSCTEGENRLKCQEETVCTMLTGSYMMYQELFRWVEWSTSC
jgi:hypothetical protein